MSHPDEPWKVEPTELRMAADRLAGPAGGFQAVHQSVLVAWDADGARFGEHFARYVQAHREAADGYVRTDAASADEIDDAGSAP